MYDSTTPDAIPTDATMVAGYANGKYAWPATAWERFPSAKKLQITIDPSQNVGDIYDGEPGNRSADPDIWPGEGAAWAKQRIASGHLFPVQYCDQNDHPIYYAAYQKAGLTDGQYGFWIADPHTGPHEIPGAIAVQYGWAGDPVAGGRNVDVSCVYAGPWVDAPAPTPNPTPPAPSVPAFPGYISYGVGLLPAPPSAAVKAFQARLNARGFYVGAVDGRDGPVTTDTLKRFQHSADITTDGIGGPVTWEKLWA
jgi:hypothetical protein